MLDLIPRFFLSKIQSDRKNVALVLTTLGIVVGALLYTNFLQHTALAKDLSYILGRLRTLTHGKYRCPLCGGTRSFLYMSSLDLKKALHYSFLGTFLYLYTAVSFPFRVITLLAPELSKNFFFNLITKSDRFWENHFLTLVFVFSILQVTLNYLDVFPWYA